MVRRREEYENEYVKSGYEESRWNEVNLTLKYLGNWAMQPILLLFASALCVDVSLFIRHELQ